MKVTQSCAKDDPRGKQALLHIDDQQLKAGTDGQQKSVPVSAYLWKKPSASSSLPLILRGVSILDCMETGWYGDGGEQPGHKSLVWSCTYKA